MRPLRVPAPWTGAESRRHYFVSRLEQLVERQAARTPDAAALADGQTAVSYAALIQQAREVASALWARGIAGGDLVAVCLERSIAQVVSSLGVLMAGAAYVPVDPLGPAERRRFILDDSRPRAIITGEPFVRSLPDGSRDRVLVFESIAGEHVGSRVDGASISAPADVAYVIYTSGSTSAPKGVLNQHDGISNHLAWMAEAFPLSPSDRVLGKTPAVFDVSVWEWFWPLSQGACLMLARPGGEKDPSYLLDMIETCGITNIQFVPTLLRQFLERPDLHRCRSLKRVFCSGEALTTELRDRFFARMPGPPELVNLYGPTEAAVHVTGWTCTPAETGPVPIGVPLPNVRTYIVDDQLNPVGQGEPGELLIGGVQVAREYLRRPELTHERFIQDPFADDPAARCYRTGDSVAWRADGAIDFFGRLDSQVQIGGARVELGEVESVLRQHAAVGDAAVVLREADVPPRLVAYLRRAHAGDGGADPTVDSLRRFLADQLADYMTPAWFIWLDEFPVTATGKLDRRSLPEPQVARPSIEQSFDPPRPGTETRLSRIWSEQLRIDRVGRHDNFHLLGGDSLGALRLCSAIHTVFGIDLPPGELLRSPTIAQLAARVDQGPAAASSTSIIQLRPGQGGTPLYLPPSMGGELLYWRELVRTLDPRRPIYGFSVPNDTAGPVDLQKVAATMVRDLVSFQPEGPYHFAGYSFSAALALEMAQQLRASGRSVGVLAMIDYGPGLPAGALTRVRTIGHFLSNLPNWLRDDVLRTDWVSLAGRVRRKLSAWTDRVAQLGPSNTAQNAERAYAQMFDHQDVPDARRRLAIDHLDAFYRYEPVPYDGNVLLFWARCRPLFHSLSPSLGWEHYAVGGYERITVACNHDNILKAPHVEAIAAALDRALADDSSHLSRRK